MNNRLKFILSLFHWRPLDLLKWMLLVARRVQVNLKTGLNQCLMNASPQTVTVVLQVWKISLKQCQVFRQNTISWASMWMIRQMMMILTILYIVDSSLFLCSFNYGFYLKYIYNIKVQLFSVFKLCIYLLINQI